MTDLINKEELVAKLTAALAAFLQEKLGEDFNEYVTTLLPAVVDLAVAEGMLAAEEVVTGLTTGHTQPYWDRLIRAASPEIRIKIMETTRQAAIQDFLHLVKRKEQQWTVFKTALSVLVSLLLTLL
jgi:hypothetical protein